MSETNKFVQAASVGWSVNSFHTRMQTFPEINTNAVRWRAGLSWNDDWTGFQCTYHSQILHWCDMKDFVICWIKNHCSLTKRKTLLASVKNMKVCWKEREWLKERNGLAGWLAVGWMERTRKCVEQRPAKQTSYSTSVAFNWSIMKQYGDSCADQNQQLAQQWQWHHPLVCGLRLWSSTFWIMVVAVLEQEVIIFGWEGIAASLLIES